ncbi:hypothetical protein TorRG33x02_028060, partial [Trema orientale]
FHTQFKYISYFYVINFFYATFSIVNFVNDYFTLQIGEMKNYCCHLQMSLSVDMVAALSNSSSFSFSENFFLQRSFLNHLHHLRLQSRYHFSGSAASSPLNTAAEEGNEQESIV